MEKYIGYGYTNNKGVAKLEYDETGTQLANTGVQGYGRGKIDLKAKMHKDDNVVSAPYELLDCIIKEDELTENKICDKSISDIDFYLEFTVHPSSDSGVARIFIREDSNRYMAIGDLFGNANAGLNWNYDGTISSFYGKGISSGTDTKITLTRRRTNLTLTVGATTYNITDFPLTLTNFDTITISDNIMKDLRFYQI